VVYACVTCIDYQMVLCEEYSNCVYNVLLYFLSHIFSMLLACRSHRPVLALADQ